MNNFIMKLKQASPFILTCVGAVGVALTAVSAVMVTPEATELLKAATDVKGEALSKTEVIKTAGPLYIPSIGIGLSTIACIFGANALNKRQQAALISSYALLSTTYQDYRNKVRQMLGDEADISVISAVASDKSEEEKPRKPEGRDKLFYNQLTGKYFESSIEAVVKAEYEINKRLFRDGQVSLNDMLDLLDNDRVPGGYTVGWSLEAGSEVYGYSCIDFEHSLVQMDDGLEVYILTMPFAPTADYLQIRYER